MTIAHVNKLIKPRNFVPRGLLLKYLCEKFISVVNPFVTEPRVLGLIVSETLQATELARARKRTSATHL